MLRLLGSAGSGGSRGAGAAGQGGTAGGKIVIRDVLKTLITKKSDSYTKRDKIQIIEASKHLKKLKGVKNLSSCNFSVNYESLNKDFVQDMDLVGFMGMISCTRFVGLKFKSFFHPFSLHRAGVLMPPPRGLPAPCQ